MQKFDESFYTEDYDQEMLDFLSDNFNVDIKVNGWEVGQSEALYHSLCCNQFFLSILAHIPSKKLTKQEFKERIGMTDEGTETFNGVDGEGNLLNFTKDDLKTGMVVKTRESESKYFVLPKSIAQHGSMLELGDYKQNLTDCDDSKYDIITVYQTEGTTLSDIFSESCLTLLWQRKESTSEDKLEALEKENAKLKYELEQANLTLRMVSYG